MNFFYLNKNIENLDLQKFTGRKNFSELTLQKSSLLDMIKKTLHKDFTFKIIDSIDSIPSREEEIIIWNSNIVYKDEVSQKLFYKKLIHSYFGLFYGSRDSYIFKGRIAELKFILSTNEKLISSKQIMQLKVEDNIIKINTIWDLKKLALYKPHTRHFNKLDVKQDCITKESANQKKIIAEFSFLNNIPKGIQHYYVGVRDLKVEKNRAEYSMEKINGMDLSMQYINQGFSKDSLQNIFDELKLYFELTKNFKGSSIEKTYNFIASKNESRLKELQLWEGFRQLDNFINNHTSFSGTNSLFEYSNRMLSKNEAKLNAAQPIISHGDLCFANILMNEEECKLIFVDPRGGNMNESYRSPYYDLAKLCHSLLGGYDHIINNIAEIQFDENMNAKLIFDQNLYNFQNIFQSFVESLGFEYHLVRIIEISLFLSMLPLHIDSSKKVNMLALRASELILDIDS